jgi:hypothetical protein
MEKLIPNNILELIDSSEKDKITIYAQFLRCYRCNEFLPDPKSCNKCGYTICSKCKNCSHELSQSRHIKTLLDVLTFKCKFHSSGCKEISKYQDVRKHLEKCNYYKDYKDAYVQIKENAGPILLRSNSIEKPKDFLGNDYIFLSSDKIFNTSVDEYERNGIKCLSCSYVSSNKKDYINHCKESHINEVTEFSIGTMSNQFSKSYEETRKKFLDFSYYKVEENKKLAIDLLNKFFSSVNSKRNFISRGEKSLNSEDFKQGDSEYSNLLLEEEKLTKVKEELKKKYEELREISNNIIKQNDLRIKEELKSRKDELTMLEIAERWTREDLDCSFFVNEFGDKCASCGNDESKEKKFFCQGCREKYCIDKCAVKCKNCLKFICPSDGKKCKLCHKSNYCDTCQKKCFYTKCDNTFCPECYKKNEHQARNSNTNCKLFTCERDSVCDCLMTSLFCSKCEKRLCNKCLMNDKEHFSFLK